MLKLNHANLLIGLDDDEAYQREVSRLVHRILLTKTGAAIDFKIRAHGWVWIGRDDEADANANARMGTPRLALIRFSPNTNFDHSEVKLAFDNGPMTVRKIRRYPGLAPDEILFHEIVHASRLIGNDFGPRNEEEFFAVLVTNIYMSEKGKRFSELRYRYDARSRGLKASEAQPYGFLLQTDEVMNEDHYVLIDKYCRQHPQVAPMIAKAPAEFNPIREYYALKEKNPISRMF